MSPASETERDGQKLNSLDPPISRDNLKKKAIHGGIWVFTFRIAKQVLGISRLVILARLLAPHDFGLFGIALLTLSVFDTFSQTGFWEALVQKPGDISEYLDISWTVTLVRGIVLCFLIFILAPFIAAFFGVSHAALFIRVIAVAIFLKALANVGVVYFPKQLTFDKQFLYDFTANVVDFIVAVGAALLLRDAWALVYGCLAGNVARLYLSYRLHPYRPRLRWDWIKIRELSGFGRWIWATTALLFLVNQGDDLVVGRLLGATALGFYQMAYRISNLTATEMAEVVAGVAFPAYARLQQSPDVLRSAFLDTTRLTLFVTTLPAMLIYLLAAEFTGMFLGAKWLPMVPAMQALAFVGLARSVAATVRPVMLAVSRPDLETKLKVFQFVLLVVTIIPMTLKWNIVGTSAAVLISSTFMAVSSSVAGLKLVGCHTRHLLQTFGFPLLCASAVLSQGSILKTVVAGSNAFQFTLLLFAGIGAYLITGLILDKFFGYGISKIVRQRFFNASLEGQRN